MAGSMAMAGWRILPAALLLVLVTPFGAMGQSRPITLSEALRLADSQSVDVRKALLALERVERSASIARDGYLPDLTARADVMIHPQRGVFFVAPNTPLNPGTTTEAFTIGSRYSTGIAVDFSHPLYNPLLDLQLDAARSEVDVAEAQVRVVRAAVRTSVEKAFYRALYARLEREAREEQINVALRNLDVTLARWRGGRAMPVDTLTANTTLVRARADVERARYAELGARLALARLLDIADYRNLEPTGTLELPTAPGPSGGDQVDPVVGVRSAELALAESARTAAKSDMAFKGGVLYPRIDAVAHVQTYGQSNTIDDIRFAMTSFFGVTGQVTISDLWRDDRRRAEAEVRVREAELEIERIRWEDSTRLEALLLNMRSARAQLEAERATVEQARKAVEVTLILYKEGRATLLDLERAQSRILDAQLAEERAKLQFLENYAELKAVVGE